MITCRYGYKIEEFDNKGLFVTEDHDGWLSVVDDPHGRKFFSIEDIEKELEVTLTLRKVNRTEEIIRN